ncbi:properdin isoform X3 [Sceloporus undulatus]|uniref:properdin isoform X3 n=1 Tax=Sceloporus undulatus TaxID=8520 RepID=UPI001C4C3747|nr:properdin isoform X3 [Sceloporus undulatus]
MGIPWMNPFPLFLVVFWGFGGLEAPAEAQDVHCYEVFDEATGSCRSLLGDGVAVQDCCLNHAYAFQEGEGAPCRACRSAKWSEWSAWSSCSVSCTEGVQQRRRTCYGQNKGTCLEGSRERERKSCSLRDCCPVDGGWSAWSAWSSCSVTCLRGFEIRRRTCTNPPPVCGGTCQGSTEERRPCDTQQNCPTHGNWGNWGNWEACPATCTPEGSGPKPRQQRRRLCNNPPPSTSPPGTPCQGRDRDHQDCMGLPYCPRDGNWGSWTPSSPCSVTCGVGRVVEKRQCNNPEPKYGGRHCPGQDTRNHICNTGVPCPVNGQWAEWSSWSKCQRLGANFKINCEDIDGMQSRTRLCTGKAHSGNHCVGDRIEMRSCYDVNLCLLDGTWTDWSPWSLCEPACGPNPVKTRVRECKPTYDNYPKQVEGQNGEMHDVGFWGTPIAKCQPLEGQKVKVVQKAPCLNVPPCEGLP